MYAFSARVVARYTSTRGFEGSAKRTNKPLFQDRDLGSLTLREATKAAAIGAKVIKGDLLVPGAWQGEAGSAEYVVHLAQPDLGFVD